MQYTSCSGILWEMKNQQVLSTFPLLDTGRLLYEIDNNYFVFTITIKLGRCNLLQLGLCDVLIRITIVITRKTEK